ncbi:polyprenyl synthetase family protein [Jatrophihabitans lederbergiae]|uniref:Polyprenyl synthetase family protein n=1 Tax=Jatrophihabitans lederbergiae TaxID=3075547 RepID=A0ABU2J7V7_9ACTN|nr:polyprenyl synthetase family protein [Jatrophihabitans sp. DSM 44399]MDT0261076.1 polyprenyl synthetase family protein [Jatrophihabitans sp. DSM 44399]
MTTLTGPVPPGLLNELSRSRSGELLHHELSARWPETADSLDAIARYAMVPAGKFLRPVMALTVAEAVGGNPEDVVPAALAMEYLHVATLTHDDIIDGDTVRRGRPTVHVAYGMSEAIVTGDYLIFSAFAAITASRASGSRAVAESIAVLAEAGSDLCRGQILEAELVDDLTAGVGKYLEMARLKTGALFRAVCHIGALLGGAEETQAAALAGYGEDLGVAFQIRDDLIVFADPAGTVDKPTTSDLVNGRPTLPVLMAYEAADVARRQALSSALARRSANAPEFEEFRRALIDTGAVARCHETAGAYGQRAIQGLAGLEPSGSVDVLTEIVRWAVTTEP